MKNKYQFAHNKPDEKRSKPDRRKKKQTVSLEDAVADFLRVITPLLKQFLNDMREYEKRICDTKERQAKAEMRTIQAVSDIVRILKTESFYSSKRNKKNSPKVLNEHKKKVVKIITEMRAKGETLEQIATYLDKEKISTFSGRGEWHAQTVHRIYVDEVIK